VTEFLLAARLGTAPPWNRGARQDSLTPARKGLKCIETLVSGARVTRFGLSRSEPNRQQYARPSGCKQRRPYLLVWYSKATETLLRRQTHDAVHCTKTKLRGKYPLALSRFSRLRPIERIEAECVADSFVSWVASQDPVDSMAAQSTSGRLGTVLLILMNGVFLSSSSCAKRRSPDDGSKCSVPASSQIAQQAANGLLDAVNTKLTTCREDMCDCNKVW
jgi:hypothetical protein